MRAAGGGTIVNVSSVAGRRGWAGASAYCTTKFAFTGLTQALAAEGAPHNIRMVCVYPGAMATHWGSWSPADRDQPSPAAPRDALPPGDVADYVVWLAGAPACGVTGWLMLARHHRAEADQDDGADRWARWGRRGRPCARPAANDVADLENLRPVLVLG
jgi:NAD(P)-dependent dehydrogenase (short-subunit alcohol dehydrogenase family)